MTVLVEYVRNIAVFTIFNSLTGAIVPNGKLKGYVDLVMNVILVLLLISPVVGLLNIDFNGVLADMGLQYDRRVIAGEFSRSDERQNELILSAFQNNLKEQARRLVSINTEYSFVNAVFIVGTGENDFGAVKEVYLTVERKPEQNKFFGSFIRIEPISVRQGTDKLVRNEEEHTNDELEKIKNAVSDFYNIPSSNIYIIVHKTD